MTDIRRQAHRRSKQSMEWGRGKSLAAVKQGKTDLARGKQQQRQLMKWGKILSSVREHFPPCHTVYCYLTVLYSV